MIVSIIVVVQTHKLQTLCKQSVVQLMTQGNAIPSHDSMYSPLQNS